MLLSRDYVTYVSRMLVRRLTESQMIETANPAGLAERIRHGIADELAIEDRLNEEVREILNKWSDEMRRHGASYQEMYKKVKGQLARERKLILR